MTGIPGPSLLPTVRGCSQVFGGDLVPTTRRSALTLPSPPGEGNRSNRRHVAQFGSDQVGFGVRWAERQGTGFLNSRERSSPSLLPRERQACRTVSSGVMLSADFRFIKER